VIDLHSHILAGFDDGARTPDESCEMARVAVAEGVTVVAATPHVREDFPTSAAAMEKAVRKLNRDLAASDIDLEVLPGGEVDLEWLITMSEDDRRRFSIAQNGRYLLIEIPMVGWPLSLEAQIFALRSAGVTPLLAHPERNSDVQANPSRIERLVRGGARVQVTAASLDGRLGRRASQACRRLLDLGLVHVLASDAHAPDVRRGGLAQAVAALRDEGLARYLTCDVPAAIVAGEPVPVLSVRDRRRRRFILF
jgi:protein-tyrosine phosphatase